MTRLRNTTAALLLTGLGACASTPAGPGPLPPRPHSEADTHFMTGMIPHHAQAVRMSALAPSRTTNNDILLLAERITASQKDEIALMRRWLRERGEPVPPADATHMTMQHGGMTHDMLMPGMLSEEQMAELAAARGREFDRLFLRFMIAHHEGAITMVHTLFDSDGAAQEDFIYAFASDVFADQKAEIERMTNLLAALGGE